MSLRAVVGNVWLLAAALACGSAAAATPDLTIKTSNGTLCEQQQYQIKF